MKLIDDWKKAWRFSSVRLGALGTAITSTLVAFPDAALAAWNLLPPVMQQAFPDRYMPLVGVAVFAMALLARLIRQDSLRDGE